MQCVSFIEASLAMHYRARPLHYYLPIPQRMSTTLSKRLADHVAFISPSRLNLSLPLQQQNSEKSFLTKKKALVALWDNTVVQCIRRMKCKTDNETFIAGLG